MNGTSLNLVRNPKLCYQQYKQHEALNKDLKLLLQAKLLQWVIHIGGQFKCAI
jgi:hypothetical protein